MVPSTARGRKSLPFQRSLLLLVRPWAAGLVVGFVVLFGQSVTDAYDGRSVEAWSWFLPNILPTLGALVAAIVAEQKGGEAGRAVGRSLFRLAFAASTFYVLVLMATLLALVPVMVFSARAPLDWLMDSSAYLGPLQGLTAGAVSYFYAIEE